MNEHRKHLAPLLFLQRRGTFLFLCLLLLGHGVTSTHGTNLSSIIPDGYAREMSPGSDGGQKPVVVLLALYITDISSVNTKDMDFRVDGMLRQSWYDQRLQPENYLPPDADYVVLTSQLLDRLWKPDPMVLNAKSTGVAELNGKFGNLVIFRDKRITYTVKLSITVGCQMDFQDFPNDLQTCPMIFESFGSNVDDMILKWETFDCEAAGNRYREIEEGLCQGVGLAPQLKLLQFIVKTPLPFSTDTTVRLHGKSIATYSRLVIQFIFERVITQYVVQTFVPSVFIICLSWFSFFMGLDSVPGRVTLLVTSQLTLVTMFGSSVTAAIPAVSYLKAMDYWMLGCLFFVFMAQTEFVLVKSLDVMYRYQKTGSYYNTNPAAMIASPKKKKRRNPSFRPDHLEASYSTTNSQESVLSQQPLTARPSDRMFACFMRRNNDAWKEDIERAQKIAHQKKVTEEPEWSFRLGWIDEQGRERLLWREIDIAFRFVFPALFILFNLIFWPMLFARSF